MWKFTLIAVLALAAPVQVSASDCFNALYKVNIAPAHESITTDLYNGRIVEAQKVQINGNNHALWRVKIYNDATGRTRHAFLKPRQWGDEDGWARTPMEYVAYALNRRLGMDYVPPTVYRRSLMVNGQSIGEASLTFEIPQAQILLDTDSKKWGTEPEGVESDHRVLSVLLQNQDGHYKNLLLGKHWVDGTERPAFIDFGASLRAGTNVAMDRYPAFRNSNTVEKVRRRTLDHLKRLSWNDLQENKEFISENEMRGILQRRDEIVKYFDSLIQSRGERAVYID